MREIFLGVGLVCTLATGLRAADRQLVVPNLARPVAADTAGDARNATYDAAWLRYEQAVATVTTAVTKALDGQFEKAADAGNLDLAAMWDEKKKAFFDTGTLEWPTDGKTKTEWRKKYPGVEFPDDFSEALKSAQAGYAAAVTRLEEDYESLVKEYTKDRDLRRAKQLRDEFSGLGRKPTETQPARPRMVDSKPEPAANKETPATAEAAAPGLKAGPPQEEERIVRITYSCDADGRTQTTVHALSAAESKQRRQQKQEVRRGIWRVTHVFDDAASVENLQGPLLDMAGVTFDAKRKALFINPRSEAGNKTALQYPKRFRLPLTVELDVVAASDRAQLQITPNANTPQNVHPFVTITTDDGFRTVDVVDRWVVSRDAQSGQPQIRDVAGQRNAETDRPVTVEGKNPGAVNAEEIFLLRLGALGGASPAGGGYFLKTLSIESRFLPTLGLALKQDGDHVTAGEVLPKSPADGAGMKAGDRILSIDGKRVDTVQRAVNLLALTEYGDAWRVEVERGGERKTFSIKAE